MSWTTDAIRERFLTFFEGKGHTRVPSSPLVPQNDPSLLFVNAGMVQFKDVFTGKDKRPYSRATTSQKCVRAGGKHNDLENVGYTPRHHTFFEMLGNFSFGDYFKEDAIRFAWEFITQVLELPTERIAVTVFAGDDEVPADDEAARIWEQVGVKPERIFRFGRKDNYWQMGDTGPQGPCSEIHYYTEEIDPSMWSADRVENSDGWLEIWNLVFMQFEKAAVDAPLVPLPEPCVDTGAGLERLAMVMQGQTSTYATDLMLDLLQDIAREAGKTYGSNEDDDVSMRVIADHARSTAFLVADGVQPSNEGRGYVLRRIMRRAIRHGRKLGFETLFFHKACQSVVERMQGAYPELEPARTLVEKVAENEEVSFRRTLDRGLKLLSERLDHHASGGALDPTFVAELYDTFGFPIDLTRVIAEEQGISVDEGAAQEEVRKKQAKGAGGDLNQERQVDAVWFRLKDEHGPTHFSGHETDADHGRVLALVRDGELLERVESGRAVEVLLDRTPFYGESGGQVGDVGTLEGDGVTVRVEDTKKPVAELVVHRGTVLNGTLEPGVHLRAQVDARQRDLTRKNHSATHMLHLSLREVLGDHVRQKGSLVAPDRLRFDFSHFEPVSASELSAIEDRVNRMVLANLPTEVAEQSLEDAKRAGAMMLFGEKYGDQVRTVRIAGDSFELCGGTHVARSGDVGLFKIVSESAVASGIRRIEALTGPAALAWMQERDQMLQRAAGLLKVTPGEVVDRVERLVRRTKELERELDEARAQAALGGGAEASAGPEEIAGIPVLFKKADGTPKKALRALSDQLRDRLQSGVVVLTSRDGDRLSLLVAATPDLKGRVHAGDLVKRATGAIGGSGGGRPDFAQGGGPAEGLETSLREIRTALEQ
jgi:alanyl-tRNA synthetase